MLPAQRVGEHPGVAERGEDAGEGDDSQCVSPQPYPRVPDARKRGSALRAVFDAPRAADDRASRRSSCSSTRRRSTSRRGPREVLAALDGDARFKLELPASQIEMSRRPAETVAEAIAPLARGARDLGGRASPAGLRRAAAGVHPFAARSRASSTAAPRYDVTRRARRRSPRRQLVFALQVHVAVGGAERALAVHNALRSYLPELAALAANAPFYAGRDSGMASVRPPIARTLPRQGIPPALESWARLRADLRWGARPAACPSPASGGGSCARTPPSGRSRCACPTPRATVADAAAVAAVVHCAGGVGCASASTPARASSRRRRGGSRRTAGRPRRHGVEGELADLVTGERVPARERLLRAARRARARGRAAGLRRRARAGPRAGGRRRAAAARGRRARVRPGARPTRWLADVFGPRRREVGSATPVEPPCPRGDADRASSIAPQPGLAQPAPPARRPRWPTTTCTSRCTAATSCTTAACRASTTSWEWEPSLLALRRELEARLRGRAAREPSAATRPGRPEEMDLELRAIADADDAPVAVDATSSATATLEQVREFLVHRSAYQLKEADPHSWAMPRLSGAPKAALVEIQADEYGGGRPERIHAAALRRRRCARSGSTTATAPTSTCSPA